MYVRCYYLFRTDVVVLTSLRRESKSVRIFDGSYSVSSLNPSWETTKSDAFSISRAFAVCTSTSDCLNRNGSFENFTEDCCDFVNLLLRSRLNTREQRGKKTKNDRWEYFENKNKNKFDDGEFRWFNTVRTGISALGSNNKTTETNRIFPRGQLWMLSATKENANRSLKCCNYDRLCWKIAATKIERKHYHQPIAIK